MVSATAQELVREMAKGLTEAGLQQDPRQFYNRTFILYFYDEEDPEDRGTLVGMTRGVQLINGAIHILIEGVTISASDNEPCDLHYLYFDKEDKKWWGECSHDSWSPSGELVLM